MTRIEMFAAAALTGVLAGATETNSPRYLIAADEEKPKKSASQWAWLIADEMEAEAQKRQGDTTNEP